MKKLHKPVFEITFRNAIYACAIIALGIFLVFIPFHEQDRSQSVCALYQEVPGNSKYQPVSHKTCILSLEKVDTEAGRAQGLSGRNQLPQNKGMLFVFDHIDRQCMWMKDMKFSLDMLWLNSQGTVIKVAENVQPSSYPAQFCADKTLFVIELDAGVAQTPGLGVGSHINL